MSEEPMLERVARAIYVEYPLSMSECRNVAKVALEAMREPTAEMLIASGTMAGWDGCAQGSADDCHIQWWQAMIDAALEGK